MDLKTLSDNELQKLIEEAKLELASRQSTNATQGYDHEYKLAGKAYKGCSYEQVKYAHHLAQKTGSFIEPNNSQLMKKFEEETMSEAISLMEQGRRIHIQ